MSPAEAIEKARLGKSVNGAFWPSPLISHLDDPPNIGRVYRWLCRTVRELLVKCDLQTMELSDAVDLADQCASGWADSMAVDERAEALWRLRGRDGVATTAVAQLLFMLSRADQKDRRLSAAAYSTPIMLLEGMERRPNEVFEHVIATFSAMAEG